MAYPIGKVGLVSKRPRVPVPSKEERNKIKQSLGIGPNESLFKCRGKSKKKVMAFEEKGDFSHSGKKHICPECRCSHTAGSGTEHYGLGRCFEHENATGASRRNNDEMVKAQKEAILQGYPDKVYKYESSSKYLERVREAADASGGMTDLADEIAVLRTLSQEMLSSFEKGKSGLTEGHDKEGIPRQMTDAGYAKMMTGLMNSVAKLTATNLKVTEADYVHVDQVNIWFAAVIRIVERAIGAEYPDEYDEIIKGIKSVPTMKKGRIK